jgi:uncharacterized metal-binding protein YceD (DUF177 family)
MPADRPVPVIRPEFSRPLRLALVGPEGRREVLEAGAAEREALARRFGIPAIASLRAELRLTAEADGAVLARGRLAAEVTQTCVATLEPVAQRVEEEVVLRFLPPGRTADEGPEEVDEIEAPQGVADLGEAMAEQLSLALDPYPRAPGAALPGEGGEALPPSGPFAALAGLSRKR